MSVVQTNQAQDAALVSLNENKEYLTMEIAGQMFGVPVLLVQDVLGEQKVTKIPLARPEIAGSLNLRGRVVTAINVRKRLHLDDSTGGEHMSIVVEHEEELYSLMVDKVGDVISLSSKEFEKNPATLDTTLREISAGIYRLKEQLLVILDVSSLLKSLTDDRT